MSRKPLTLVLSFSAACDALMQPAKDLVPRQHSVGRVSVHAVFPSDMSYDDAREGQARAKRIADVEAASAAAENAEMIRAAADDLAAAAAAVAAPEQLLLELVSSTFAETLAAPGVEVMAQIDRAVASLEDAARTAFDGTVQPSSLASAALEGDWRLVYTDSKPTLEGGVSGIGALPFCSSVAVLQRLSNAKPRAQCIEIVGLPLGVKNAVVLKGDWQLEVAPENELRVTASYATAELAGGTLPPGISGEQEQLVKTVATHVGSRVRVERASNGAVYVWERQATPIEQTVQMLIQ